MAPQKFGAHVPISMPMDGLIAGVIPATPAASDTWNSLEIALIKKTGIRHGAPDGHIDRYLHGRRGALKNEVDWYGINSLSASRQVRETLFLNGTLGSCHPLFGIADCAAFHLIRLAASSTESQSKPAGDTPLKRGQNAKVQ